MNFLYPQFLYGLLALAIPVIIHLFNFRKTKRVYFSNTRFLRKVKDQSSAKRKLKHYLILASRLLAIFFLVMAFAQPFIPSEEDVNTSERTLIYLDNSLSTTNEKEEGLSVFDESVSYVNQLVSVFPASQQYKLVTNDFDNFSHTDKSKQDVQDYITEVNVSGVTRSIEDVYNRLTLNTMSSTKKGGEVFWISDFQSSTAGNNADIKFDSTYHVNLVPVRFSNKNNVYVDSVYLDNPFLIGDGKLKLNVVFKNIGPKSISDLSVKVFIDDIQSATSSINLDANDETKATFDLAFNLNKNSRGRISFEDFPVTFDNDFYFTINGNPEINVLEIKSNTASTPIGSVYANEDLFNFKSYTAENVDYGLISLSDLVVINGLDNIDASLAIALNKYVQNNGHVFIIPSAHPILDNYKSIIGLEGVQLADSAAMSDLNTPDFSNPFFANIFEEKNPSFVMPKARPVLQLGIDRSSLLSFKTGTPFLSMKSRGAGAVYVLASPLASSFSTFQSHAVFVPVMYRLAAESATKKSNLYHYIDDAKVSVSLDSLQADNVIKLKQGDTELIPQQRFVGNEVKLEVPKFTLKSGFYDVIYQGLQIGTLAFNNSPEESDLSVLSNDDILSKISGNVQIIDVADKSDFEKTLESKYVGQALWKYAILLALLFLVVEVLLIRFLR